MTPICFLTNENFYYIIIFNPINSDQVMAINRKTTHRFMKTSVLLRSMVAAALMVLLLVPAVQAQDSAKQVQDAKARQRLLKREALNALWRLKRSLEKDGFYSARVALNVWRTTAMDAGTFDQAKYDAFKKQLYEKSVNDSLRCFEQFLLEEDFYNANFCLQTWRMHARELGSYRQEEYEALKKKLADAKASKPPPEAHP